MKGFFVYMLRCRDATLYTGWTTDPARRLEAHNGGRGAKYTRGRGPVKLAYLESLPTKEEALRREAALKRLTRRQKLDLIEEWGSDDEADILECQRPSGLSRERVSGER